ncbi:hypothetical protein COU20_03740 [Candidatus Kaiserbacteria bacterium CG10_big_fil_rev_8_21_14_0_10_59_10]|uniref:Uncharacterized protein n=1 Tax=Candidatus Kaiserbacteria bacterium CG10_big_fil_rev_8_21_14_0_10_59_10 TaxID=1974612 RepID=A0A2H0U749_9BACT|nr:MAG: hypothetical protein COU20_03740 [Candidatus Kaiserbacteria bacterium CG10_big_fil_rev_8_21_14_0_10_59_10]
MEVDGIVELAKGLPIDWVILSALAAIIALDTLRSGAGRALALSLALLIAPLGIAAISQAAYADALVERLDTPYAQAALFAVMLTVFYALLRNSTLDWGYEGGGLPAALAAGLATAAIAASVWVATPALSTLWEFSPAVQGVFGVSYGFWWLLAALLLLAYARR